MEKEEGRQKTSRQCHHASMNEIDMEKNSGHKKLVTKKAHLYPANTPKGKYAGSKGKLRREDGKETLSDKRCDKTTIAQHDRPYD